MTPFRLALLSLTRRRVPTLIALVSIALSVAFSGVLLRLYVLSGSRFSSVALGPDAVVGAKAGGIEILLGALNLEGRYPGFIPYKLYASLKNRHAVQFEDGARSEPSFVKSIVPFVYFGKFRGFRVIGTDDGFLDSHKVGQGRWVTSDAEVVLGASAARREGVKVGDKIVVETWTSDSVASSGLTSLEVVGILEPTGKAWDSGAYSRLEAAWKTFQAADLGDASIWKEQVIHYFLVYLEPGGFPKLESLINRRTVAQGIDVPAEFRRLEALTGSGRDLGLLVSILITLLGALGVTAMMVTRFDAMGTQLAVLRAMGYEKKEIRSWLLWEGALLGTSASFAGALVDLAIFPLVRNLLGSALPPPHLVTVTLFSSGPVWAWAVLGTTTAVFLPLYRLYHQDVHFALRA